MGEARMDGTAYEAALFRIQALREALSDITTTHASNPDGQHATHMCALNALQIDDERAAQQQTLRADLRDALSAAHAWLGRWAVHAGNCRGGASCTCGLLAITTEAEIALVRDTPPPATATSPQDKA